MRTMQVIRHAAMLVALIAGGVSSPAHAAATIDSLRGTAEIVARDQTTVRLAAEGGSIEEGERVRTGGGNSQIDLKFTDGTRTLLVANTNMLVERYAVSPNAQDNVFAIRVLRGAFRVVSGLIAKRNSRETRIFTTVATIGVRGTDFSGEVEETSAKVVLNEPETKEPTAIEVYNDFGRVVVDQPGFGTEVPDQFSPPSPVRQMQLRTIQNILRAIRIPTQPITVPRVR